MCYNIVLQMCDKNVQGKHDYVFVCMCARAHTRHLLNTVFWKKVGNISVNIHEW